MKIYDFDEIIDRRGSNCLKYDRLKNNFGVSDLMPFWVADMDFRTPDFIVDALRKRCEHPIFGYTYATDAYYEAIILWIRRLHGWDVRREWVSYIAGIVKGISLALDCFTKRGDKVVIQTPVYHPFRLVPERMGRNVVYNPLHIVNGFYKMDFDQLESVIGDCKVLILSSPHNPAGIVWGRQTLCQLAEICSRHHVLVISDEIHSEMVFPTHDAHIPFAVISPAAAANSITFMAPSKTFNIAGIISSYAIVPDDDLRRRFFTYLEAGEHNQGSIFAYTATQAAYEHGEAWRRQMIDYVMENVRFVNRYLKDNIPQIRVYMPEASFLIWLDCRDFRLEQADLVRLFVNSAGLALNDGTMFGHEGNGYMRLNVGCPRSLVAFGLDRLKVAIEKNHSI